MGQLDRHTLCRWFDAHRPALSLYARQLLPPSDQTAVDDLLQELFIRLLVRTADGGGLEVPPNPAAWLHRCVRNACQDQRRSRTRRQRREEAAASARRDWFEPDPAALIDAQVAQAVLETLPDLPRQVVVLRIWSGLTLAEAAEVVGLPISTVHDHYRKALAAIRRAMEAREQACLGRKPNTN